MWVLLITAHQEQLLYPLNFLSAGNYNAEIYKDAPDAVNNPNKFIKETKEINSSDKLTLNLPAGGGEVIRLRINNQINSQ